MKGWRILMFMLWVISMGVWMWGCASSQTVQLAGKSDEALFREGVALMEKEKWEEARQRFRFLVRAYLQSPLRARAQLYLADCYFREGGAALDFAVNEYQEFLRLFPTSPDAPYALFQIGMCYFRKSEKPQRTQENTWKALEYFQKVIAQYPNTEWRTKAQEYYRRAAQRIIAHEMLIARFYYKRKLYAATMNRIQYVLTRFSADVVPPDVYWLAYETAGKLGQTDLAREYLRQLAEMYPRTEWGQKAQKILRTLGSASVRPE